MRRKDREVTSMPDILAIISKCPVMRLAMCDNGQPYIIPLYYAYKELNGQIFLYFHCAREGRKNEILARNNRVCFEVDNHGEILPGENACNWSALYESVIGEGFTEYAEGNEKREALDLIMARYGYHEHNGPQRPEYSEAQLAQTAVIKVNITCITGKAKT